jgi:hypothetical protein
MFGNLKTKGFALEATHLTDPNYSVLDALNSFDHYGRTAVYDEPIELAAGNVRNDDQVDSISQALTWSRTRPKPVLCGPIIIYGSKYDRWSNRI